MILQARILQATWRFRDLVESSVVPFRVVWGDPYRGLGFRARGLGTEGTWRIMGLNK